MTATRIMHTSFRHSTGGRLDGTTVETTLLVTRKTAWRLCLSICGWIFWSLRHRLICGWKAL